FAATLGAFEHLGGEVPKFVTFLLQPFRGGNHQQGEAEKKQIEVLLKTLLRLGYQPNSVIRWAAAIGLLQGSFEQLASEGRIVEALLVAARDWQHSRPDVVPLVAHLLEEGQCQIAAVFSRSMGLLSQFGHVIVDRVVAAGKVTPALRFICDTGLPIEKPKIEALLQQLVDSGEVSEAADLAPALGLAAKFGQEILDGLVAQGQSQEAFKFVESARIGRKIGGDSLL
ncbi:MAG: hypothetical protein RMJ16_15120, partial [Thermoguttaceae bacterium]|nr:hypothetical protein [Thermoguttaceae bacterium]